MADYAISYANLTIIERNLGSINSSIELLDMHLEAVGSDVARIDDNVKTVCHELHKLAEDFYEFAQLQIRANAKSNSQQRLIQLHQEMEKRFGHYDAVRRMATGILQADDLGIVRRDTITTATEELMLSTPNYWLAPCLVTLAAWIDDQPDLAEKALREAIKRDDEKTSLFFALICRRANRKPSSLKWAQRYLANQDEENLSRETIIVLDAFACGLLGADTEGLITRQLNEWLSRLTEKPGFTEQQTSQWIDAINLKRKPYRTEDYPNLSKYSRTWSDLESIMEGALLHAEILNYFTAIFNQEMPIDSIKAQLDEILNSLVSDFDEEELPLRKEEKYHRLVVDFEGNVSRAQQHMQIEETAFEDKKDFTQLLTDAAMKPDISHASVSTQKFAIALSKDWISTAYNDVVAQNRARIPYEIEINVDSFDDKTTDGQDEKEILRRFGKKNDAEREQALSMVKLSGSAYAALVIGLLIGLFGLVLIIFGTSTGKFLGIALTLVGLILSLNFFSKRKKVSQRRKEITAKYDQKRKSGIQIIRALIAEIVDFRAEFAEKDAESQKVLDFLERIRPEQYVRKLSESNRKIKVLEQGGN
ncbi:MAG: hypothetical protein Q4C01_05195 [Clostridia bacterium]|nr:hypothetical protein [Clostridia bacterium]